MHYNVEITFTTKYLVILWSLLRFSGVPHQQARVTGRVSTSVTEFSSDGTVSLTNIIRGHDNGTVLVKFSAQYDY